MVNRILAILVFTAVTAAADSYQQVLTYETGQDVRPLRTIEAEIRKAPASQYPAFEAKMVAIIKSPTATVDAKAFACRQLRLVGSAACVPVVAPLLTDAKLSDMARYALQEMTAHNVNGALRDALAKTTSQPIQIGLINSLGLRGDERAVGQIAKFINAKDPILAAAALHALGNISSREALRYLSTARIPAALQPARDDAYLKCADRLVATGKQQEAEKIYKTMFAKTYPLNIRIAALRGLVVTEQEKSILLLVQLIEYVPELRAVAGGYLVTPLVANPVVSRELVAHLNGATPVAQVALINAMAERGDETGSAAITKLLESTNADVAVAAARALGSTGNVSTVPALLATATKGGDLGKAAESSLQSLRTSGIDAALIAQLPGTSTQATIILIQTLAARRCATAVPAIVKASKIDNADVRTAVFAALGVLVEDSDFKQLVDLFVQADGSDQAEAAVRSACRRLKPATVSGLLLGTLPAASTNLKCALLRLLGQLGGPDALSAVRKNIGSADAKVADTAARVLADWNDAAAIPDLLALARSSDHETYRVLAFRGAMRLLSAKKEAPAEMVKDLDAAMKVAPQADEKKLVIGALGELKTAAALPVLATVLADPALQVDAGNAYLRVVDAIEGSDKSGAVAGLEKFLVLFKDEELRTKAKTKLQALQAPPNK
jgi:HEAT repeat protein